MRQEPVLTTRPKKAASRPYPAEDKETAIRLLRHSTFLLEEIAYLLNIKLSALRGWACERSISLRWRSERSRRGDFTSIEDRDRDLCEVMLSNRVSLAEMAERYDLTREGVRQVALRWGVLRPPTK